MLYMLGTIHRFKAKIAIIEFFLPRQAIHIHHYHFDIICHLCIFHFGTLTANSKIKDNQKGEKKMVTITNTVKTIGEKIVDFMDRVPGLTSAIISLVIVAEFYFKGK